MESELVQNPNRKIRTVAFEYSNPEAKSLVGIGNLIITKVLQRDFPEANLSIGGSLLSGTNVDGKYDIDINWLLGSGFNLQECAEEMQRYSRRLSVQMKLQKVLPRVVTTEQGRFVIPMFLHEESIPMHTEAGFTKITVEVKIARGQPSGFGLSYIAREVPRAVRERYVREKYHALQRDDNSYKSVKYAFFAMLKQIAENTHMAPSGLVLPQRKIVDPMYANFLNTKTEDIVAEGGKLRQEYQVLEDKYKKSGQLILHL
jgi:hypothetical protein